MYTKRPGTLARASLVKITIEAHRSSNFDGSPVPDCRLWDHIAVRSVPWDHVAARKTRSSQEGIDHIAVSARKTRSSQVLHAFAYASLRKRDLLNVAIAVAVAVAVVVVVVDVVVAVVSGGV